MLNNPALLQHVLSLHPPEASGGYFGLALATLPPHVERFSALTFSGKLHQLGSPDLQDIFIEG